MSGGPGGGSSAAAEVEQIETHVAADSSETAAPSAAASPAFTDSPMDQSGAATMVSRPFVASDFVVYLHLLAQQLPQILLSCDSLSRVQIDLAVEEIRMRVHIYAFD